jgi:hypothetical protein
LVVVPLKDHKIKPVTENKVIMKEKEKAKIEVKRQKDISMELMEEKNTMKEELKERGYAIILLKRDAECYSRYFAQIDDEYEGLKGVYLPFGGCTKRCFQRKTCG